MGNIKEKNVKNRQILIIILHCILPVMFPYFRKCTGGKIKKNSCGK